MSLGQMVICALRRRLADAENVDVSGSGLLDLLEKPKLRQSRPKTDRHPLAKRADLLPLLL